jgi:hypothetical protein
MSLLGSAIVSICVSAGNGSYQTACTSALQAGTQQTGFDKDFQQVQDNTSKIATNIAQENVPERAKPLLGSFVFLAKTAIDRRLVIDLPHLGWADKIQSEFTPNSAVLSLKWGF